MKGWKSVTQMTPLGPTYNPVSLHPYACSNPGDSRQVPLTILSPTPPAYPSSNPGDHHQATLTTLSPSTPIPLVTHVTTRPHLYPCLLPPLSL